MEADANTPLGRLVNIHKLHNADTDDPGRSTYQAHSGLAQTRIDHTFSWFHDKVDLGEMMSLIEVLHPPDQFQDSSSSFDLSWRVLCGHNLTSYRIPQNRPESPRIPIIRWDQIKPSMTVEIRPLFSQTCTARIQKFPDGSGSPQMFPDVSRCFQMCPEVSRGV
eukprot:jgi/Chrzof1/4101/UNPLg00762.t1